MAFTPYHNITGTTGVDVELIKKSEGPRNLKTITIANIHASADATVDLSMQDLDRGASIYYFVKGLVIVPGATVVMDIPAFWNGLYSLVITVGSSDTVDVILS
jgi:hypothetical protein